MNKGYRPKGYRPLRRDAAADSATGIGPDTVLGRRCSSLARAAIAAAALVGATSASAPSAAAQSPQPPVLTGVHLARPQLPSTSPLPVVPGVPTLAAGSTVPTSPMVPVAPLSPLSPAATPAQALPVAGQVVAGQASIATAGPAATPTMTIHQTSARAAIDWQRFDVGQQARVHFVQPGLDSVTLNRVQAGQPSQIFGHIQANGQVFLTNPDGVYFAPGARVDVGGLVATTHRIGVEDFMAGRLRFEREGATGSVINAGSLEARLGGYVALLAPEVRNEGVILARMGAVALAAGEAFELRVDGHNTLAALRVDPATIRSLVENRSVVLAPGGLVILSAQAADRLHGGVIRHSGRSEATGLQARGGRLILEASDTIDNSGRLAASGSTDGPAGSVELTAPDLANSGAIEAIGDAANPRGGRIDLIGGEVVQTLTGSLDASGPEQGGAVTVRAGGTVRLGGALDASAHRDVAVEVDRDAVRVKPMRGVPAVLVSGVALPASEDQPILGSKRGELPRKPVPSMAAPGLAAPGLAVPGTTVPGLAVPGTVDIVKKPVPALAGISGQATNGGRITVEAAEVSLESADLDVSGAIGGQVLIDGRLPATGAPSPRQDVAAPSRVTVGGETEIRARGRRGDGGRVTLLGNEIIESVTSQIRVDGATSGGTVQKGSGRAE